MPPPTLLLNLVYQFAVPLPGDVKGSILRPPLPLCEAGSGSNCIDVYVPVPNCNSPHVVILPVTVPPANGKCPTCE